MAKSIYLTSFDFDTFKNDTFKSVIFKKKILSDLLDELANFKQKKFYTFDFYTFKRGKVDRLRLNGTIFLFLSHCDVGKGDAV